ncbi:hypothetical protein K9O30_10105 [Clostridium bowmanii]|uniref:hypothetical protein n=1 Tax=Clostridium bowmanii TaxID=132925 RepID=UPI001C0E4835|nr:hypothetical protein [Clostridium bowmanii]MBU3189452.1 hypothetical protein [Clostridium bowmanii]MCA1074067.1 hypothetical protein [Clostridium bowmanii]
MYKLKENGAMHNNDALVKNISFEGIIIGNISFEIVENSMHVNDINIDIKYTHKNHATNLLIQLVKEFNIDIIDGTGTYDEGEYFWERLGAKMSEYIYTNEIMDTQGDTPQYCCLGRDFKLSREQLIKYSELK